MCHLNHSIYVLQDAHLKWLNSGETVWDISLRPICIPCTLETSAALKLPADSTCKQQGDETPTNLPACKFQTVREVNGHAR